MGARRAQAQLCERDARAPRDAHCKRGAATLSHEGFAGARLVRIRVYWIIGFLGFVRRVSDLQTLVPIRLGGIFGYGEKRKPGESKS